MKDGLKVAGFWVLILITVMAIGWIAQGNQFFMYKFFAPKQEQVRRDVFEQSKAYRQGVAQELQGLMLEYQRAAPEHRAAIRTVVLHKSSDTPADALPSHINAFLSEMRNPAPEVMKR